MTAGGKPRIRSKTQAWKLLVADQADDRRKWAAEGAAYIAQLHAAAAGIPALAAVIRLHEPRINEYDNSIECSHCGNCCYGSEPFPCETMQALIAEVAVILPPPAPPERHIEDYWPDPYVTVTFAHLTHLAHDGKPFTVMPGKQLTMRHSVAKAVKSRLMTSSMKRVEAMS